MIQQNEKNVSLTFEQLEREKENHQKNIDSSQARITEIDADILAIETELIE